MTARPAGTALPLRSRGAEQPVLRAAFTAAEAAELGWQEHALCAQIDPEMFFPEKGGSTRDPKRVCAACEVRDPCLQYALDHDERFGVWGGYSERERRRLKGAADVA